MFKLKPKKPTIIKHCPRWLLGYNCRSVIGQPCLDCGRGVVA